MRVIIRFSVDGDPNSRLRNELAKALAGSGIVTGGRSTATYENPAISRLSSALHWPPSGPRRLSIKAPGRSITFGCTATEARQL